MRLQIHKRTITETILRNQTFHFLCRPWFGLNYPLVVLMYMNPETKKSTPLTVQVIYPSVGIFHFGGVPRIVWGAGEGEHCWKCLMHNHQQPVFSVKGR